jgi:molecular chaperone GrpE
VSRPPTDDDDVVYLDEGEGRNDVARAMRDAERAVSAVEERHRHQEEAPGSADGAGAGIESEMAALRERLVSAEEESGRVREALLRKAADFENLKRRTEKEKSDYFKFALAETFRDILGVLDNFERAMAHADAGAEEFRTGIAMIERQLSDVLKKYGLVEVLAEGRPFDPNVHEAVMTEETAETRPGTVLAVLQRGYLLADRLLRPALVKVAAAPKAG